MRLRERRSELHCQPLFGIELSALLAVWVFSDLWFWQVTLGVFGDPWYGSTYNLALELRSSLFPMLPRAIEQEYVLKLRPGDELCSELEAAIWNWLTQGEISK